MKNKNFLFFFAIFLFVIFIFISIFIYKSLLGSGIIALGDFTIARATKNWIYDNYLYLWNENGYSNLGHLSQLFIFSPLFFFSKNVIISAMHWRFFYFVLLSALSGTSVFFLARYLFNEIGKLEKGSFLIISASSFFYIFSTFVVEEASHQTIKYAFYLAPLILFTLIKGINENKKNYLLFSVILWSLTVSAMHWVIFGGIIFLGYIIYDAIYKRDNVLRIIKRILTNCIFVLGIFLLLNSYWIIPLMLSGGDSPQGNIMTKEWGLFGSGVSDMMAVKGIYNPLDTYGELPQFLSFLEGINLNVVLIILTIIGLLSFVLVRKKHKGQLFFGLLFVLAIFLSAGPRFAPELFNWLMFEAPFSKYYREAFRTPRFSQFLILALAPLIAITGIRINQFLRTKNKKIGRIFPFVFLIIVVVFSVFSNYPLLTGDFNGRLKAVEIPGDYKKTVEYLKEDNSDYKVIWGPPYAGSKSSWHINKIGALTNEISPKLNRAVEESLLYPLLFGYRLGYEPLLLREEIKNINDFLSPLNVKYLIINNDIPWLKEEIDETISYLRKQDKLEMKKENGFISIFEVKNPAERIRIVPLNIDIFGGLEKYNSLTYLKQFNPVETGIVYRDQKDLYETLTPSKILVTGNDLRSLNIMKAKRIELRPFDEANYYNPNKLWSKARINSASFRAYLDKRNLLTSYQFDYGRGLVFTSAKDSLNIPFNIEERGNYKLFVRYLKSRSGGEMTIHLDGEPIQIETIDNQINKFIWKELGEFNLEKGEHQIMLENIKGFNAVNLFSLISEQEYRESREEIEKDLQDKTIIYILEAESDFYRENLLGVESDFNASNGNIIRLRKDDSIWQELEIIKKGTHKLALKGVGEFEVSIDGKKFRLNSNNLDFVYSSSFSLDRGNYILGIKFLTKDAKLDVIWFYSTEKDQNLEHFFEIKEKPAKILDYKKINPTLWKIIIKTSESFMLSFAESYDPLWEARIYKDEKKLKVVKSTLLYSVINGFWIDEIGDLEIEIRYKPQDWFEIGIWPSGITLFGCFIYLGYDWRKRRRVCSCPQSDKDKI